MRDLSFKGKVDAFAELRLGLLAAITIV